MAENLPKKITQYASDGVTLIETFESVNQAVKKTDISFPKIKAAAESGNPESGFIFKYEKQEEPVTSPKEDERTYTLSETDLKALLGETAKKMEEKIRADLKSEKPGIDMKEFAEVIADAMNQDSVKRYSARSEAQIDPDDFLEEPTIFFCYLHRFAIFGEKRYGHEVTTPYRRPLVFDNISGHVSGAGFRGKQTVQISACQITTKKELEWMRKSPKLGVIVFEQIGETTNMDHTEALQLSAALNEISALSDQAMVKRALSEGIKANKDIGIMRKDLIKKIASQNLENEKRVSREAASSASHTLNDTKKRGVSQIAGANLTSY